ncbi:MAG: outer membrane lipoprotein carrier protein LolA [Elusimicrobia bacterium]|nr:outer membrane lipoprotein carrier protein LolA [Elusimicrobiota bacterium]
MNSAWFRIAAASILLSAAVSRAAAAPADKPKKAAKSAPSKAAKTAVDISSPSLVVSTAPTDVASLVEHFKFIDANVRSLKAKYRQSVVVTETGIAQQIEGTVDYSKPSRLHIEHVKPERQTVVSDGKQIWVHRLEQNQVIQSNLDDWRKADPVAGRFLDLGNYSALMQTYDVAFDSKTLVVLVRPKESGSDLRLKLHLSGPALFPAETELSVGQMRIKTSFEDVRFNVALPDSLFQFTPPEGAEVFRNFKPPISGGKPQ